MKKLLLFAIVFAFIININANAQYDDPYGDTDKDYFIKEAQRIKESGLQSVTGYEYKIINGKAEEKVMKSYF